MKKEFNEEEQKIINQLYYKQHLTLREICEQLHCIEHNIPLIRIPYKYNHNICIEFLNPKTTKKEFIVKNINHYKINEVVK